MLQSLGIAGVQVGRRLNGRNVIYIEREAGVGVHARVSKARQRFLCVERERKRPSLKSPLFKWGLVKWTVPYGYIETQTSPCSSVYSACENYFWNDQFLSFFFSLSISLSRTVTSARGGILQSTPTKRPLLLLFKSRVELLCAFQSRPAEAPFRLENPYSVAVLQSIAVKIVVDRKRTNMAVES